MPVALHVADQLREASPPSPPPPPPAPLLKVENLRVHFPVRRGVFQRITGHIKAVDDVNFQIQTGQTLGLVGESGCGKTTVGRAILRLVPATGGRVLFEGRSIFELAAGPMRLMRRQMQIIFQDPAGSLNPRMKVGQIIAEPLEVHDVVKGRNALRQRSAQLLERCGLHAGAIDRYPHEFSGGQRQRIGIARALALQPRLIICDEPTSALDVSIQAQILNLLKDLQDEFGLGYLFISHDMAVVHHICDRIAVMLGGKIVEQGDREQVIHNPQHPYTRTLLAAVPQADAKADRLPIRQRIIPV